MKQMELGKSGLMVPCMGLGCLRFPDVDRKKVVELVQTAMELGVNFFDHADVYGSHIGPSGYSEAIFAEVIGMSPSVREKIIIQTKCGIDLDNYTENKPHTIGFNFSKEHILRMADESLKNLHTDYIDVLLLHIPDALVEPEEIAEAFDVLETSGKVRHFGVSNHTPWQIEFLKKYIKQPLVANQMQLSVTYNGLISQGLYVGMDDPRAISRDGDVLSYCRLKDITIQCWSPYQAAYFTGTFLDNPDYPEVNAVLGRIAEKYGTSKTAVSMAWLLRHPAHFQPIVGTMNKDHLREAVKGTEFEITRDEWYEIWKAAGNYFR